MYKTAGEECGHVDPNTGCPYCGMNFKRTVKHFGEQETCPRCKRIFVPFVPSPQKTCPHCGTPQTCSMCGKTI